MSAERCRTLKVIKLCGLILLIGLAYAVFVTTTNIRIPCVLHELTGLDCPGCGLTRLCLSVLRLDFKSAWNFNKGVVILSPLLGILAIRIILNYIKTGIVKTRKIDSIIILISIIWLIVWGIVRNII